MRRNVTAPARARLPRITCPASLVLHHTVFLRVLNIPPRRKPRYDLREPLRSSAPRQRVKVHAGCKTEAGIQYQQGETERHARDIPLL